MRKIVPLLLILCLLTVSGCSVKQPQYYPETENTSAETTTMSNTEDSADVVVDQLPMVAVSVPVITQNVTAEDGTVILKSTYQNISVTVPDPEVADKVIIDFLNRTDINDASESILSNAKADYVKNPQNWTPYLIQSTYDPMRIDQSVLSMFGSHVTYEGAAHATANYRSVSYDLITGDVLSLQQILEETVNAEKICQLVVNSLNEQMDTNSLYEDFEITVEERFGKNFRNDADWFFSEEGLCFFFSPYEIGPYSSGVVVAQIPYSSLAGIIKDAYFPAEKDAVNGVILVEPFDETALNRFTQFAEVVLVEGSEKILLYTNTLVYNIRIETGSRSDNNSEFIPQHTVLAAYTLTPGDAIMIDAPIHEEHLELQLTYTSADGTIVSYLSMDEDTNTVILSEN